MARRPDDVQVQLTMPQKFRARLGKTALDFQALIPTDRVMDRGSMINFVMAFVLELPASDQLDIITKGREVYEAKWKSRDAGEIATSDTSGRSKAASKGRSVARKTRHPLPTGPASGGKVEPGSEDDAVLGSKDAPAVKN